MKQRDDTRARGVVYINLGPYLQKLKLVEKKKPKHLQRPVPSMKQIAKVSGITRQGLSKLVTGETRSLNLDLASAILDEMRRLGFKMQMTDLITYIPPENNHSPKINS